MAIDMETATIFSTAFYNEIPTGAILLVSDQMLQNHWQHLTGYLKFRITKQKRCAQDSI